MKPAYYNEINKYAAQWLRNLIAAGEIAPGDVDERSIEDVRPDDLRGYKQCHFFAGIGVWSYALRRAGWPDDRPIWTGSCPCQPFSAAGQGTAFADERHLWPAFYHLIGLGRPPVVGGEQVASKDAEPWLDLVHTDLEALGYAFGAVAFPSAGVGAPHIRDRTFWLGYTNQPRLEGHARDGRAAGWKGSRRPVAAPSLPVRLAHSDGGHAGAERQQRGRQQRQQQEDGRAVRMADAAGLEPERRNGEPSNAGGWPGPRAGAARHGDDSDGAGPTNGYWRAADWLGCTDGKWRPVEPDTFPLVDGAAARMGSRGTDWRTAAGAEGFGHRAGRLHGYGNAINAEAAIEFMKAAIEYLP